MISTVINLPVIAMSKLCPLFFLCLKSSQNYVKNIERTELETMAVGVRGSVYAYYVPPNTVYYQQPGPA